MPQAKRTYVVELRPITIESRITFEVSVDTQGLALKQAELMNPRFAAVSVDGERLIGRCCVCEMYVLEGDRFTRCRAGVKCDACV